MQFVFDERMPPACCQMVEDLFCIAAFMRILMLLGTTGTPRFQVASIVLLKRLWWVDARDSCCRDRKRNAYLACECYCDVSTIEVVSLRIYSIFIPTGLVPGHVVG